MPYRSLALLSVFAVAAGACNGDDMATAPTDVTVTVTAPAVATVVTDPGTDPDGTIGVAASTPPSTAAAAAPAGSWSVAAALAEVPDTGADIFEVVTADLSAIEALFGLERPSSLADVDAVLDDWVLPLTFPGTPEYRELPLWVAIQPPLLPADVRRIGELDELLGWSLLDVDAFVHYQPEPPGYLVTVAGEFADDALAGLTEVAPGVVTNADGEDFTVDPSAISGLDALGRPVRLARTDDRIAMSLGTPLAADWLDRTGPTLAEDAHIGDIAAALDDAGVLTAHLFRFDFTAGAMLVDESSPLAEDAAWITEPFEAIGIGWTVAPDGEPTVVLAYATDGDPAELAEQVERAFVEGVSLVTAEPLVSIFGDDDPEVAVDGSVVTVTYRPGERLWFSAVQGVYRGDLLFTYR